MIHNYVAKNEINGFSAEQLSRYKFFRHDHSIVSSKDFFDFPIKTDSNQRYIYVITIIGALVNRFVTFLPKDHIFHIPDHVVADIKNNLCKLVFDYSREPLNCTYNKRDLTNHYIQQTMAHYGLVKNQVILITANVKIYKNVPFTVCVVFAPISFIPCATKEWTNTQTSLIKNKAERKYKILSLMRQTKKHRIKFAYDIFRKDYRKDNLITCHLPNNKEHFHRINHIPECGNKEFFNSLPWVYDHDPHTDYNVLLNTPVEQTMYLDSYINFVIESFVDFTPPTTADYELDISEKIFKPISRMQPSVIYGQPGVLAYLKSIGYQSFDHWWDESYDTVEDSSVRYNMIFSLFEMLNSKSTSELADMIYEMLPVLEHNRTVFEDCVTNKLYLKEFNQVLAASFDK